MGLVNLINLSVFFIPPSDLNDRLSIVVTLLLTMIAFQYVISEAIPRVPYTTLADRYMEVTYVFFLILIFYCCIASVSEVSTESDSNVGLFYFGMFTLVQFIFAYVAHSAWEDGKKTLHMGYTEFSENQLTGIFDVLS